MELFLHWLLWFSINLAAVISPGPAFAMTVRTALAHDRRAGIYLAMGLGGGVAIILVLIIFGFALILSKSSLLFSVVKFAGAGYLIFVGIKAIRAKKKTENAIVENEPATVKTPLSRKKAFGMGVLTNALNPKALLFFTAFFTQFVTPATPWFMIIAYTLTAIILEAAWFALVALILTDNRIKQRFLSIAHWVERGCGGLMIMLGIRLAFTKGMATT